MHKFWLSFCTDQSASRFLSKSYDMLRSFITDISHQWVALVFTSALLIDKLKRKPLGHFLAEGVTSFQPKLPQAMIRDAGVLRSSICWWPQMPYLCFYILNQTLDRLSSTIDMAIYILLLKLLLLFVFVYTANTMLVGHVPKLSYCFLPYSWATQCTLSTYIFKKLLFLVFVFFLKHTL